jgi:hypothetical protein
LKWLLAKAKTFWLQLKAGEIVHTYLSMTNIDSVDAEVRKSVQLYYIRLLQIGLKTFKADISTGKFNRVSSIYD